MTETASFFIQVALIWIAVVLILAFIDLALKPWLRSVFHNFFQKGNEWANRDPKWRWQKKSRQLKK